MNVPGAQSPTVALALSRDIVHVWCQATNPIGAFAVGRAKASLSREERERGDRFRFPEDRRDYLIAHDLLRRSLSRCYPVSPGDWQFEAGPRGQPLLRPPGPTPSFSLSHTRGLVACAIACGMSVGLDAERVEPSIPIDELTDNCFTSGEVAALRRCPDHARPALFVELWTLKEAFLKATGLGLTGALNTVPFEVDAHGSIRFAPPPGVDAHGWHFNLLAPSDCTRVAVAVRSDLDEPPRFMVHHVAAE